MSAKLGNTSEFQSGESERKATMKAILLDGTQASDQTGERVRAALVAQLETQGWDVEHVVLREKTIRNCGGDFYCWTKHPGTCMFDDDNRAIAEAIVESDVVVYLTPVTFGGYSSVLKRMVDHEIQNISPFFTNIEGETHHRKRYRRNPDLLAVGWMDAPDADAEAVFRNLAHGNALNMRAETCVSGVALASQPDGDLEALAQRWLNDLQNGRSSPRVKLPESSAPSAATVTRAAPQTGTEKGNERVRVRRALLLVGSPRMGKSTSNSLGSYLFEQLDTGAIQTETIYLHAALRSPESTQAMLDAVDTADLITLAFPLYVDTLPAPVIEALERIAAHRQGLEGTRRTLFTAIANCGFPEAHHNATALATCEIFAREAGFEWAGALALGGGQGIDGAPLADAGGMAILPRKSLELAAEALAQGRAIPQAAQDLMAKSVIPPWAYRLLGGLGWLQRAKQYGAIRLLWQQPYRAEAR